MGPNVLMPQKMPKKWHREGSEAGLRSNSCTNYSTSSTCFTQHSAVLVFKPQVL